MKTDFRKGYFFFSVLIMFLMFLGGQVYAETFCINSTAGLHTALDTAASNGQDDTIQIVRGTYYGNFVYASTEAYGITVEGGYAAGCASRVVDPLNTHLDGSRTGRVLVLSSTAVVSQFAVDGLTIRNGYLSNQSRNGLYVSANGGSVTITNTRITKNAGGSYITGAGTITFVQNDLSLNESFGLLVHPSDNIVLESNTIHDNYGLGVLLESPRTASLKNNTITDNVCPPTEYFYCGVPELAVVQVFVIALMSKTIESIPTRGQVYRYAEHR